MSRFRSFFQRSIDLNHPALGQWLEAVNRDDGSEPPPDAWDPIYVVLCLVLNQCLNDNAVCFHTFEDEEDGCVRFLEYAPLPPGRDRTSNWAQRCPENPYSWTFSPADDIVESGTPTTQMSPPHSCPPVTTHPSTGEEIRWAWIEMMPVPIELWEHLASLIRTAACMRVGDTSGYLKFRRDKKTIRAHVVSPYPGDLRLYWESVRPMIRAKTPEHRREVE